MININFAGYITGMELKGILQRIERRLKAVRLSAEAASKLAGKPDAIRNLRRIARDELQGRRGVSTATLEALAPVLKTTVVWLHAEEGPEVADQPKSQSSVPSVGVPIISMVQAGNIRKPEYVEQFEDAPRFYATGLDPKGEWIALEVEGDSMDRISPPESIILVNLKDRRLVPNACYIIADEDGGASYKRYRAGVWQPVSTNKRHKAWRIQEGKEPRVIGRVRRSILSM